MGRTLDAKRDRLAFTVSRFALFDDGEDFVFAEDEEFLIADLDFGAGVGGEDDFIAFFDLELGAFAGVEEFAIADGDDGAALGLFLGGFGEDDAGLGLGFGLDALEQDLVTEGADFCSHGLMLL